MLDIACVCNAQHRLRMHQQKSNFVEGLKKPARLTLLFLLCVCLVPLLAQNTKTEWPHVYYAVPPFDHTTCNITFDYKKEGACPAAGTAGASSVDMYDKIASYAHSILDRYVAAQARRQAVYPCMPWPMNAQLSCSAQWRVAASQREVLRGQLRSLVASLACMWLMIY